MRRKERNAYILDEVEDLAAIRLGPGYFGHIRPPSYGSNGWAVAKVPGVT
jgi:hypothetical protein